MIKKILFTVLNALLSFVYFDSSYGQDTITIYDVATKTQSYRLFPGYDTSRASDSLDSFIGHHGFTAMPDMAPVEKYPGSIKKASDYYTNYNFPFTAVTSIRYGIDITAAVIGPRTLLVYNYDVYNTGNKTWRNLSNANPLYVNGAIQYGFSKLTPVKYYTVNPAFFITRFALIEVAENIGNDYGYFGLAYDTYPHAYDSLLLYNLSYPNKDINFNSNIYPFPVNGDTLFMKYGRIKNFASDSNSFFFDSGGNGEYVSPYFDAQYRIRGIRWSNSSNSIVKRFDFNFAKFVLDSLTTGINEIQENDKLSVYPNPATKHLTIQFPQSLKTDAILLFTNVLGQTVLSYNLRKGEIKNEQEVSELPNGIYLATMVTEEKRVVARFVKE